MGESPVGDLLEVVLVDEFGEGLAVVVADVVGFGRASGDEFGEGRSEQTSEEEEKNSLRRRHLSCRALVGQYKIAPRSVLLVHLRPHFFSNELARKRRATRMLTRMFTRTDRA